MRIQPIAALGARLAIPACVLAMLLTGSIQAAQQKTLADTDWTVWLGPSSGPQLRARLRDKDQNGAQHIAAVEAEVRNVFLDNPANVVPQTGAVVGVLRYQLDQCAPVVTTDTRLSFQQLAAGNHVITLTLVGLDNRALAPNANLQVTIP
jgi:hypothetical protein